MGRTTGNVGIGTTSPRAKLEVVGNIIADAPTAWNHVATKAWVELLDLGGPGSWTCTIRSTSTSNTDNPVEAKCVGAEKFINGFCGGGTSAARFPLDNSQGIYCYCPSNCGPSNWGYAYANCCE